jgi:hypothetical protein
MGRYGQHHKNLRRRWRLKIQASGVDCARCGEPIKPDEPWDLGHVDGGRPGEYSGPEHRACNRAAPIAKIHAIARGEAKPHRETRRKLYPAGVERWSRHWSGGFNAACGDCRTLGGPCKAARKFAPDEVPPAGGWVITS